MFYGVRMSRRLHAVIGGTADEAVPNAKLPELPEGMSWSPRGWGWTNGGKPCRHCVKTSKTSGTVVDSEVGRTPRGNARMFYWEAVGGGRSVVVDYAIPRAAAPEPESMRVDADVERAWKDWTVGSVGRANLNVGGVNLARLGAVVESRLRVAFEAGFAAGGKEGL